MSVGQAALVLCILGVPSPNGAHRLYPSDVDEAIRYIKRGGDLNVAEE